MRMVLGIVATVATASVPFVVACLKESTEKQVASLKEAFLEKLIERNKDGVEKQMVSLKK